VVGNSILLAEAIEQHVRGTRGKERSVIPERLHGRHQIAVGVRFHDVRAHTGLNNVANELIGKVESKDYYFRFGKALADTPGGLQAVKLGHADVHYYNVWLQLLSHGHGFATGLGLGDDVPAMVRG
jgi:hypothetical protein